MEIPKEISVFRSSEEAQEHIANYVGANKKSFNDLLERIRGYKEAHPDDYKMIPCETGGFLKKMQYPPELFNGLEFICHIGFAALSEGQTRTYDFEGGILQEFWPSEGEYPSIQKMADVVGEWLQNQGKRVMGSKVTPFFYTIDEAARLGNNIQAGQVENFVRGIAGECPFESLEQMQKAQEEIGGADFEEAANSLNNTTRCGLDDAEREEFRKAFFGG